MSGKQDNHYTWMEFQRNQVKQDKNHIKQICRVWNIKQKGTNRLIDADKRVVVRKKEMAGGGGGQKR